MYNACSDGFARGTVELVSPKACQGSIVPAGNIIFVPAMSMSPYTYKYTTAVLKQQQQH